MTRHRDTLHLVFPPGLRRTLELHFPGLWSQLRSLRLPSTDGGILRSGAHDKRDANRVGFPRTTHALLGVCSPPAREAHRFSVCFWSVLPHHHFWWAPVHWGALALQRLPPTSAQHVPDTQGESWNNIFTKFYIPVLQEKHVPGKIRRVWGSLYIVVYCSKLQKTREWFCFLIYTERKCLFLVLCV